MESTFKPQEFLGYLLAQAKKGTVSLLIERFRQSGYDITRPQWIILVKSFHFRDVDLLQSDVVEMMMGNKTGVTRAVEDLVKRGLINQEIDQQDRRNRVLRITDAGLEMVPQLMKCAHETIGEATEGISEEDLAITKKVLAQIIENVKRD